MGWREELREWLLTWMDRDLVDLFMNSLVEHGKREVYWHTPGVPKKIRMRIKGIGSFVTDSTPYPDGTTEFEFDPKLMSRIERIERLMERQARTMETFAVAMEEHVKLVKALQEAAEALKQAVSYRPRESKHGREYARMYTV